jgi:hypothetical protein
MRRHLLYEAASALMTRCRQWSKLRTWGLAVVRRRGPSEPGWLWHANSQRSCTSWASGSLVETGVKKPNLAAV